MKKILFPMDFDKAAYNAFIYALRFAQAMSAEIVVISAFHIEHPVYNEDPAYPDAAELGEFETFQQQLPELYAIMQANDAQDIKITHRLESGEVVDGIIRAAQEESPDLIIMGTSQVASWQNDTRTHQVMARTAFPVLGIPEKCQYVKIQKAVFLTRFHKRHMASLEKIYKMVAMFQGVIDVVELAPRENWDTNQSLALWRRRFLGTEIKFRVVRAEPTVENINTIVESCGATLLAFEEHPDRPLFARLGKVLARNMMSGCNIPLLSIPVNDK